MSLGRRTPKQVELWTPTAQLTQSAAHPFYRKLNEVFAAAGFDAYVEELCAPYYKDGGRPGIPPGVYFRMHFIGYFEGIDSQRGIAWRCQDSRALGQFLGLGPTEDAPDHSALTKIRQRLPEVLHDQVFQFVLRMIHERGLLRGQTLGVDATTLEANAAMKSIVRRDSGAGWKDYLRQLAKAEGIEHPTDEQLRRLDRKRPGKKVPNDQWVSPSDADSRITKMKDGTTHLAYKAEHAVDLASDVVVAVNVTHADRGDAQTGPESLILAQANLVQAGSDVAVTEVVADKGYHDNHLLARCAQWQVRTYIPERQQASHRWTDKPGEYETAFRASRRRVKAEKGKRLNRQRSEQCERSFAHVCETGGGRRMWVRGLINATKSYVMRVCAYNLGVLLRKVFGMGKPRSWASALSSLWSMICSLWTRWSDPKPRFERTNRPRRIESQDWVQTRRDGFNTWRNPKRPTCSTGW